MSTITARPPVATAPVHARPGILAPILQLEQSVLALLRIVAVPALRVALAVVYVWFGALKVLGLSPVADLVSSMMPFLPAQLVVVGMGVAEIALGVALLVGVLIPWIAAAQVVHLLATFAVFVVHPDVAFTGGNPLAVTFEGEFIAKNLVLVAGLLVVAAFSGPRPWGFLSRLGR
ncbi:MAG TPA: DoxX family membrane protein [Rhodoglobus sp.]|nr:DoxX family membrane protein [Rhodoglobus sp.]